VGSGLIYETIARKLLRNKTGPIKNRTPKVLILQVKSRPDSVRICQDPKNKVDAESIFCDSMAQTRYGTGLTSLITHDRPLKAYLIIALKKMPRQELSNDIWMSICLIMAALVCFCFPPFLGVRFFIGPVLNI
jgi:hypothetical protein